MTINNKIQAGSIKFSYYLAVFLYLAAIVLFLYLELHNNYIYISALTTGFISLLILSFMLKLNFIIYTDVGNNIILRYYPLHPFHEKFKSIEIPKMEFLNFDIKKGILKMRTEITLYQKTGRGIAKYPAVSITSLKKKDRLKIIESLNNYVKKNN